LLYTKNPNFDTLEPSREILCCVHFAVFFWIWFEEEEKEEMPPKQQPKADLAKKQKQVEDKTFGLKNKNKSKNVQKYVQSLKQSVQPKPDASKVAAKVTMNLSDIPLSFLK